jgi:Ca-activated chloride channel family protein
LSLAEDAESDFAAVAPTKNVTRASELLPAVRSAVYAGREPPTARRQVFVEPRHGGKAVSGDMEISLTDSATADSHTMKIEGGRLTAKVPPGLYRMTISGGGTERWSFGGLAITADSAETVTPDVTSTGLMAFAIDDAPISGGDTISVRFWEAPSGEHWLTAAYAGMTIDAWSTRARATGPSGEVELPLPVVPGQLVVRFVQRLGDGVTREIGRTVLETRPMKATLEHPESVEAGSELTINWSGPDHPGDHITLAREGVDKALFSSCRYTLSGNPAAVLVPDEDGSYVLRYISGLTGKPLVRQKIEIAPKPVTFEAPQTIGAGRGFSVRWRRASDDEGYVVLAATDAAVGDYVSWRPDTEARVAEFTAPRAPGSYELRFVRSADNLVIGRRLLEVTETPVRLEVGTVVSAGTRFDVVWTGPDSSGDFITVSRRQTGPRQFLDFAYTSAGSPANLAAPFKPGLYEVRYVSHELEVLHRLVIKVE